MARKQFYSITNAAGDAAKLSIFDEIGFWGITAADFARDLAAITAPVINLEINSPGGSVFDGIAIYNLLRSSGKQINATVMGVAASIASVILMSADKITMPANSMVMVHAPSGGVFGTAEQMRDMADVLDKVQANLVATYVKRTGMSEEDVKALLVKDTWLTAAEAKEKGFADEVIEAVELTAAFDITDERVPETARTAFKAAADARTKREADEAAARAAAEKPFAERVTALLAGTGFEAHAGKWAAKFKTADEITAQLTVAREVKALFDLAKHGDKADALIARAASLDEARTELQNALAADDKHIDTSRTDPGAADAAIAAKKGEALKPVNVYARRSGKETAQADKQGPSAGSTAAIWANRNK